MTILFLQTPDNPLFFPSFLTIYHTFTTFAPNGNNDNLAILKNCFPNGIPTMVMHRRHPITKFPIASSKPDTKNQIMLRKHETAPPSSTISFPKGSSEIDDSLKHCNPTGIPTTVMHHKAPAIHHPKALSRPPHITHIRLPRNLINQSSPTK